MEAGLMRRSQQSTLVCPLPYRGALRINILNIMNHSSTRKMIVL